MSGRRRLVWLVESNDPSGAARMAVTRALLHRSTDDTEVLCLLRSPRPVPRASPFRGIRGARSVTGRVQFARAQVVVTTCEITLRWAVQARGLGTRLVHVAHRDPRSLAADERFMEDVAQVEELYLPSLPWGAATASRFGLDPDRVGVHRDFVAPHTAPLSPLSAPVALFVGRMRPGCGALELARGFALVADELPDWSVRFAGWGAERPLVNRVAAEHHLGPRLLTLGASYDVSGDLLEASVCVRPGTGESQGLWVREALAHGVPVIGSPGVPAVAELVEPGRNGLHLERTDPVEVAEALLSVARDPELLQALAEGAAAGDALGEPDVPAAPGGRLLSPPHGARPLG